MPIEYSIERPTWAITSRLDALKVGLPGVAQDRLLADEPVLGIAVLVFRGGRSKAAELLVLWHENAVRPCRAASFTGQSGSGSRPPVSALT